MGTHRVMTICQKTAPEVGVTEVKVAGSQPDELSSNEERHLRRVLKTAQGAQKGELTPSRVAFVMGVCNAVGSAFVAGVHPEFYWIWQIVKTIVLLPLHASNLWPKKQILYMTEFCWVCSVACAVYFIVAGTGNIAPDSHGAKITFRVFYSIAMGPLGWSVAALSNALVFHSVPHTSSLFIHMSPMVSAWCMHWHESEMQRWSFTRDRFPVNNSEDNMVVFGYSVAAYFVWWVPFTIWLVVWGVNASDHGYATCFNDHCGKRLLGIESKRLRAVVYSLGHAVAVMATLAFSILNWEYFWVSTAFVFLMLSAAVHNGATRYVAMFNSMEAAIKELLTDSERASEVKRKVNPAWMGETGIPSSTDIEMAQIPSQEASQVSIDPIQKALKSSLSSMLSRSELV